MNLRWVAAGGARLAVALDYLRVLMPFHMAVDEYDLPEIWASEDVDRRLVDYATELLGDGGALGRTT